MTGDVEWDRLADYAAGALDGTPEAAEVARLVAVEPAWARAYVELTAVDRVIAGELADLGTTAERLPAEVAARLDEVLAQARQRPGHSAAVPGVASLAHACRRRRRWTRGVGVAAVAAGLVAFGAFVVPALREAPAQPATSSAGDLDVGAASRSPNDTLKHAAPPGVLGLPNEASSVTILASGLDYHRGTVTSAAPSRSNLTTTEPSRSVPGAIPSELDRLNEPAALRDCLTAITVTYGGRVLTVDFARFEGVAALIARITSPDQVVVAGASCGLAAAGADARYRAAVN